MCPGAGGGRGSAGRHPRPPSGRVHPLALGTKPVRGGTPASGSRGHPTPPPLPGPAAVSGKGGLRAAGQLLSPSETDESAPAGRAGGGGGDPVTAPPRAGSAPSRPPTRRAPRPARPEGACRPSPPAAESGEVSAAGPLPRAPAAGAVLWFRCRPRASGLMSSRHASCASGLPGAPAPARQGSFPAGTLETHPSVTLETSVSSRDPGAGSLLASARG